ncbi:MAG: hypothetical protein GY711_27435 [bacterium]|nr:hypothetical protein [bacterium]
MRVWMIGLLLLCGCSACKEDGWTFALSRSVYESIDSTTPSLEMEGGEMEGIVVVALLAIPLVVDIVALPVTVPRDLIVMQ